ncbi:NADPH:quinone reductase [Microbacterium azadirachtae]|uniref:NADPH:quinone reductase n=1 Tax=Microbacterium azadirachtae TaxID=582680 RepID=A0A1I6ILY3_9MICO|nr:NADP-dependent oxidoreductase [Microbacterium azadirachtae]SFR67671.1 NADPH:quinone reductase [Microbacterium azadirachtae]
MRAAVYSAAGSAQDVIAVEEVEAPIAGAGEVLVRVAAVGLNPVDVKIRAAGHDFGAIRYTERPGWDVAGTVVAVGPDVEGWSEGDAVFALARFPEAAHTLAEFVALPVSDIAAAPRAWSAAQAGAAPLAALTAWQALDAADVGADDGARVLVLGGAGGVGHLAVQLAKARGAHVIATAGPAKQELVTAWGADEVVDHHDEDALAAIAPVDAVIVTVSDTLPPRGTIREGTAVVTITGYSAEQEAELRAGGADPVRRILVAANGPQLAEIAALADAGRLTVHLDSAYRLSDLAAAQERVETGHVTGKVVVVVDPRD